MASGKRTIRCLRLGQCPIGAEQTQLTAVEQETFNVWSDQYAKRKVLSLIKIRQSKVAKLNRLTVARVIPDKSAQSLSDLLRLESQFVCWQAVKTGVNRTTYTLIIQMCRCVVRIKQQFENPISQYQTHPIRNFTKIYWGTCLDCQVHIKISRLRHHRSLRPTITLTLYQPNELLKPSHWQNWITLRYFFKENDTNLSKAAATQLYLQGPKFVCGRRLLHL